MSLNDMIDSIFIPQFSITPEVKDYLTDIERQEWLINNMLLMPKYDTWIRRRVSVRRAGGTTRIEGFSLDDEAVNKLVGRVTVGKLTEDEQANVDAIQAYQFIDFLSDQDDIAVDELVIRELNRQFISHASKVLTPGAYRKGQNKVGNFSPPDQGDVPDLMRSFALWLRDPADDIHPILKAGIAHIHLVAIHPFWDGNGRTARGLMTLVLQRSRFGFRKLLSLEENLSNDRDSYFTAIERTLGTHFSTEYDATLWLDFFTRSLHSHVYGLMAELTDWHRAMEEVYKTGEAKGWLPRQMDGLAFAAQAGQITRSDYMEISGVSPATASRDLAEMVKSGALIPEGNTRTRIYRLPPVEPASTGKWPEEQLALLPEA